MDNKIICGWCLFPIKRGKLIKCNICGKKFCKSCLVQMDDEAWFCISCSINALRTNTSILIFKTDKFDKKIRIKKPINEVYKNENCKCKEK